MPEVVVSAQDLSKQFGDFVAVDHVSFEVQAGEVVGYLGPNGSGKTTTLRMLLGLLLPSSGRAVVLGHDVMRETESIRAQVGYMSQKFALYDELSAWENLAFYAGVYGVAEASRIQAAVELLGLTQIRDERAGHLPIGWRQRLALATAIVHQPPLLILDEPTSGVDPIARRTFWDVIYALADEGVTAFVTTHYTDEAEYCNRVGIMRRGQLLAIDAPSRLKRNALPGHAWDVRALPLLDSLHVLQGSRLVIRAGLAGDHLRAITGPGCTAEMLRSALVERGLQVEEVVQVEPTLEDVFLALAEG